jgi:anti-sigma-K factor RskA
VSEKDEMTCEEFKELAGAYALGALDRAERLSCARHLGSGRPHAGCAAAVADAERITAQLALAVRPRRPSADTWRSIEARIRAGDTGEPNGRGRGIKELVGWFVVATLVGLYLYDVPIEVRRRPSDRTTRRAEMGLDLAP